MADPRSRTHIILKRICSRLPWSHEAVRSVHQRPYTKTGIAPDIPNSSSAGELGERNDRPPWKIALPDARSVSAYMIVDTPMTTGAKPKSAPSLRMSGPYPHKPGFE